MMERLTESLLSRSRVPLESISTFSILLGYLKPASRGFIDRTIKPPPFKLFGHVYASPSVQIYFYVLVIMSFLVTEILLQVMLRIFHVLSTDTKAPIIAPTVHSYSRKG